MSDQLTTKTPQQTLESGENPGDYFWPWHGETKEGHSLSMNAAQFITWASIFHPEYVDTDNGSPLVSDFVITKFDAEAMGEPELEQAIAVTIRPDLDGNIEYSKAAEQAAARYPANPKIKERFLQLAKVFADQGI